MKPTPWAKLNDFKCGWWVENDDDTLAQTLNKVVSISKDEWLEMARKGQQVAVKNYSAKTVSCNMIQLYHWVLGEGNKPVCVYLD